MNNNFLYDILMIISYVFLILSSLYTAIYPEKVIKFYSKLKYDNDLEPKQSYIGFTRIIAIKTLFIK